ncbi:MAG: hypothetical protein QW756_00635 [Nitrososphaerota archaeon]
MKAEDGYYLHVTFKRGVEEREPRGVLGIDVNEKSIDIAVINPSEVKFIKVDISEAHKG